VDFTSPAPHERRTVPFTYDGEQLTARQPKQSTIANLVLSADTAKTDPIGIVRHFKTFLMDALDPESYDYLTGRIEDPDDDLDWDGLEPVIKWLVEEFTGSRPTQRSSASTRRPTASGTRSTGRSRSPRASTPAASTETAS
jgi:hypothetical protein